MTPTPDLVGPRWEPEQLRQMRAEFQGNPALVAEAEGSRVLGAVEAFIVRYVVLPKAAPLVIALWAVCTHLASTFDVFPYLSLYSPIPRCGKTRLLEVLELLVAHPWRGTAPTQAVLFRFIEAKQPTLLLDEVEGLAKRNPSENDAAVLAILNAGYRKGQTVPRCVGSGHHLRHFSVYGPKAFGAIGNLPDTLRDRSIVISMQRRAPGDQVARFRFERAKREADVTRTGLERIVKEFAAEIQRTYSNLPELSFLTDRDEELFAPLFAVCGVFAPSRLQELERCAKTICDTKWSNAVDDSLPLRLLADIQTTWPRNAEAVLTDTLISSLQKMPESPWNKEIQLNPRKLASLLRGFEVRPRPVRVHEARGRGYIWHELKEAWTRYLPSKTSFAEPEE